MNCNVPTDICFSFTGFQARGGKTDVHQDGWGIAFFEGKGVRQFLDPMSAASSPIAELVRNYPIKSKNVVAHIRKATQGVVSLENTHPFMRELWGYYWIFAHNGDVPEFKPDLTGLYRPVGNTDSERAFCWIMQNLRDQFGETMPSKSDLFAAIHTLTLEVCKNGEFNFLMTNGDILFAHASTNLTYIIRKAPFPQAQLKDEEVSIDFSSVTTVKDRVAVIATVPLTDNEQWTTMNPGTFWMFHEGAVIGEKITTPGPVKKKA